jgi:hypothetical protein
VFDPDQKSVSNVSAYQLQTEVFFLNTGEGEGKRNAMKISGNLPGLNQRPCRQG